MSIKPVAVLILPLLFVRERSRVGRISVLFVPALTVLLPFLPYSLSANPFEALTTFAQHWNFNGFVFEMLNALIANNQTTRLMCAALLSFTLLAVYRQYYLSGSNAHHLSISPSDNLDISPSRSLTLSASHHLTLSSSVLLLLLFSPVVHPWYISWLVVLLPLAPRWSVIVYAATASLTALTVLNVRTTGIWGQSTFVLLLEYVPVAALFGWEVWNGRRPAGQE
jgi:hypothetical protein